MVLKGNPMSNALDHALLDTTVLLDRHIPIRMLVVAFRYTVLQALLRLLMLLQDITQLAARVQQQEHHKLSALLGTIAWEVCRLHAQGEHIHPQKPTLPACNAQLPSFVPQQEQSNQLIVHGDTTQQVKLTSRTTIVLLARTIHFLSLLDTTQRQLILLKPREADSFPAQLGTCAKMVSDWLLTHGRHVLTMRIEQPRERMMPIFTLDSTSQLQPESHMVSFKSQLGAQVCLSQ